MIKWINQIYRLNIENNICQKFDFDEFCERFEADNYFIDNSSEEMINWKLSVYK